MNHANPFGDCDALRAAAENARLRAALRSISDDLTLDMFQSREIASNALWPTNGQNIMNTIESQVLERAVLVNQAPFGRAAKRLLQSDFQACSYFARGLAAAGVKVMTMACNEAGDISFSHWSTDLDNQPFSQKFSPVNANLIGVE